jgi:hypothetical protein
MRQESRAILLPDTRRGIPSAIRSHALASALARGWNPLRYPRDAILSRSVRSVFRTSLSNSFKKLEPIAIAGA